MTVILAIIGVVFTGATLWVGWQNMQMAGAKLQHDLFDRRFRVYEGAARFMAEANKHPEVPDEVLRDFLTSTRDAILLFDDESIERHLRAIYARVCQRNAAETRLKDCPDSIRGELVQESLQASIWLGEQSDTLAVTFRPYIGLPKIRTVPQWMERLWLKVRPG